MPRPKVPVVAEILNCLYPNKSIVRPIPEHPTFHKSITIVIDDIANAGRL
jgi:hypothetical protein